MMEYKGYTGRITALDDRQGLLHGEVIGLTDVITFQGKTVEELVQAFHDSVDDYLEFCQEGAELPEKPCSGKFLVRISPELHQQAARAAEKAGTSLNSLVGTAIQAYLENNAPKKARPVRHRKSQAS